MDQRAKIHVAGADTMIGAALVRELHRQGYDNLCQDEDLEHAYVFVAAGKSGGIAANQKQPATLMLDNLQVATDLIAAAHRRGVNKLLYLASSCIYPKHCPQPMRVESLLSGALEPTSEAYAIAKLAGLKLCQAYRQQHGAPFITAIPADVFGPGSSFSAEDSHVLPALIRKMHDAKEAGADLVELWGTGSPRREFTYADDLADACVLVMRTYDRPEPINLGVGTDISIKEVAELIREVVGYRGALHFDSSKPDGAPVKLLDSTVLRQLGWRPRTPLREALERTYQSLLEQRAEHAHAR